MRTFFQRGGGWVLAQFALMLAVGALAVMFPGRGGAVGLVVGGGLLLLGAGFGLAGAAVLGRNRTPFPCPREGSQLVRWGIYARVRHPLYTSVILLGLGWACVWHSAVGLGAALLLIPFFRAKARREERWLGARFPEYEAYRREVPAFLPRPRRGRGASNHPPSGQPPDGSVTH